MTTPTSQDESSLIRALENEQQYGVPRQDVPTEVSHRLRQPGEDAETCVSSVTDVLQNADLFVDHMYPTLNAVVEEEESHSNMVLKSLNNNSNRSPTISTTTTEETQRHQTSRKQYQQHESSGDISLNQSAVKEELQSNEAAVLKAAKMDMRDQASPAVTIAVGIGSRKSPAAPADKSDQQQDDQKDLPSKQSKPEATMQFKETTTSNIDPTISAIDLAKTNLSEDRYPIGAKNMEGSFREAAQVEIQPLPQQPALNSQQPVSIPGAYSHGFCCFSLLLVGADVVVQ
ncbi:hypothetical protein SEMRO_2680_G334480.1 [Seminavis robusta]|uniref:Uncharacterized protein n=1 Tax=Seminavis robusta TaxID=568900 RepID=A0A9N8EZV9_9STRA|nr:hypothetical protein SEMRO_2680_G334480.1 [Seminavis robusta]|eukprot:Sro2680_g334480.1 n/a (287) ;mRNA; f:11522-12487